MPLAPIPGSGSQTEQHTPSYLKAWACYFVLFEIIDFGLRSLIGAVVPVATVLTDLSPMTRIVLAITIAFLLSMPVSYMLYRWSAERFLYR